MHRRRTRSSAPVAAIYGGISLLRAFSGTGIQCHAVQHSNSDLVRYSRDISSFTQLPPADAGAPALVAALFRFAEQFDTKPVLFYGNDRSMRFVSDNRIALSDRFRFLMPAESVLKACSQKNLFDELTEPLSIKYPKSIAVRKAGDLDGLERLTPPFVLKPDQTAKVDLIAKIAMNETQKALLVGTEKDARRIASVLLEQEVDFILQEAVRGSEDNIFSYHAFNNEKFQPLGNFVGRKVRTYPSFGGCSTCLTLSNDAEVRESGRRLAAELGIAGPVKIDFKRDSDSGSLFVIEANPRFTLWNHLGAACGINLSRIAYQYLTNSSVDEPHNYRTDRQWIRFKEDFQAYREAENFGILPFATYPFQRKNAVSRVFSITDPLPFLVALKREYF